MLKPALFTALLALCACGNQPAANTPDDEESPGEGEGGGEEPKPSDNIVRDADGDGVPDEKDSADDCTAMSETKCKITSACAWNDEGKCVAAKSSPM